MQPLRVTIFFLKGNKKYPSKIADGNPTFCRRQNDALPPPLSIDAVGGVFVESRGYTCNLFVVTSVGSGRVQMLVRKDNYSQRTLTFCVERSHLSTNTPPNEVLRLFFWKAFVYRKWHKMHQNEGLFSVFVPLKSGF